MHDGGMGLLQREERIPLRHVPVPLTLCCSRGEWLYTGGIPVNGLKDHLRQQLLTTPSMCALTPLLGHASPPRQPLPQLARVIRLRHRAVSVQTLEAAVFSSSPPKKSFHGEFWLGRSVLTYNLVSIQSHALTSLGWDPWRHTADQRRTPASLALN